MVFIKKESLFSFLILSSYIILCFYIYNNTNIDSNKKTSLVKNQVLTAIPREDNNDIIMYLEINKLNLLQPIYYMNHEKNNVEENVTILEGSILPIEENNILFLAAHSGEGSIAYFNHLDKLVIGDQVNIYMKNHTYQYIVNDFWEEKKNGFIHVNKNKKKQLILTTCSTRNKEKQLVVSAIEKE